MSGIGKNAVKGNTKYMLKRVKGSRLFDGVGYSEFVNRDGHYGKTINCRSVEKPRCATVLFSFTQLESYPLNEWLLTVDGENLGLHFIGSAIEVAKSKIPVA